MKASIILLCYNHKKYLKQCLDSIFCQHYKDIELLFLDNCSTDGSFEYAKSLLDACGLEYSAFQNEKPRPVTANLNFLLAQVKGDIVFPFSSDDWMAPDNISEKMALFHRRPELGIVFGGGWWYYEDKDELVEANIADFRNEDMLQNLLLNPSSYFWIGTSYPAAVLREVGGYDEQLAIEDLDLHVRIALKYPTDFVPKSLVYYRRHSAAFTSNYSLMWKGMQQFYQKHKNNKALPIGQWMVDNYRRTGYVSPVTGHVGNLFWHAAKSFLRSPGKDAFGKIMLYSKAYLFTLPQFRKGWGLYRKLKPVK